MAAESGKKYVKTYKPLLTNKTVASLAGLSALWFRGSHPQAADSRVHSPATPSAEIASQWQNPVYSAPPPAKGLCIPFSSKGSFRLASV